MQESHSATLNLDNLPVTFLTKADAASILTDLAKKSLLSLVQLCNNGCDYILLDKGYVGVIIDGVKTIIGTRDTNNGLWSVALNTNGNNLPATHPYYVNMKKSVYAQKPIPNS